MLPSTKDEPFYNLGVLFVHGIGQSSRGETLLSFGEPLCRCIERIAAPFGGEPVQVSIAEARLDPEPWQEPAQAILRIRGASRDEQNWLLAEAWWAKKFPTQTIKEILTWGFKVLPWTLLAHLDRGLRRTGHRATRRLDSTDEDGMLLIFMATVRLLFVWSLQSIKVISGLAALPILLATLGILLVLGLVPYKPVRDFAASIHRKLASTIGDSFALMDRPMIEAAITSSVRERLEWLSARCRRVVIIAHSQGAAIAHRMLRERLTAPCDVLITFGSGLGKLAEIRRTSDASDAVGTQKSDAKAMRDALETQTPYAKATRWLSFATAGGFVAATCLSIRFGLALKEALSSTISSVSLWSALVETGFILECTLLAGGIEVAAASANDPITRDMNGAVAEKQPLQWYFWLLAMVISNGFLAAVTLTSGLQHFLYRWPELVLNFGFSSGLVVAYLALRRWQYNSKRSLSARVQQWHDRDLYRENFEFRNRPSMWWYDLFATADPVPNGPLLDEFRPRNVFSFEFVNAHSLFSDHTAYWRNKDELVPFVAGKLLEQTAIRRRPGVAFRAGYRRRWRVRWEVASRWALLLTAAAVGWHWALQFPALLYPILTPGAKWPFPLSLLQGHPQRVLVTVVIGFWAVAAASIRFAWSAWDKDEIHTAFLAEGEYQLAPVPFLLFLGVALAWIMAGAFAVFGPWALLVLLIPASLAIVVRKHTAIREWLQLQSDSGNKNMLRERRLERLKREAETARRKGITGKLTEVARELSYFDPILAEPLWQQAIEKKSVNAAWELGLYYYRLESNQQLTSDKQASARQHAKAAFRRGFDLKDPNSAWFYGGYEERGGNLDRAIEAYRVAVAGEHVYAPRSLVWALEKAGHREEAEQVAKQHAENGNAGAALFLADRIAGRAEAVQRTEPEKTNALRNESINYYRRAFNGGEIDGALGAGRQYRKLGNIIRARRAFRIGSKLRNATCAYELGMLEEEELQDRSAALEAYRLAIRLDEFGAVWYSAGYRIGKFLEEDGNVLAAIREYRVAMGKPGSKQGSAEAALSLARVLQDERDGIKESKAAYQRAVELRPHLAGEPCAAFLERTRQDACSARPIVKT